LRVEGSPRTPRDISFFLSEVRLAEFQKEAAMSNKRKTGKP
jgi:hypothetical protein